ncbi:Helix-turn-helix domain protein [Corynebacterium kalinowskii]|uniref:Helix-turn-helix domain protein n=1 Tax=Corynebacterium kalinowskii TaxID=2675216 RepID=A0A6B8VFM2_9CORY|nr:ArsR family transcriptional regulator [Corynebacterium kalinowskii]QGU01809.1 Helix-turn-helix domain protein [Corynebacterium kalinowskii]
MDLEQRIDALERRLAALEAQQPSLENGIISFQGDVLLEGRAYQYAWTRPADHLTGDAFFESLERVSALAHPIRHAILARLLEGPASVNDLVDSGISSSGTAYHHLSALQSAGWVRKIHGTFEIPPARVIPLLTIIAASEDNT